MFLFLEGYFETSHILQ